MLWPKNVLNVLKFYIFPFLIVVQEINLKTRTYFRFKKPTSLSLNQLFGTRCLVKTLYLFFRIGFQKHFWLRLAAQEVTLSLSSSIRSFVRLFVRPLSPFNGF